LIDGEPLVNEPGNPGNQTPFTWLINGFAIRVLCLRFDLVTDANVANRYVNINWLYGANYFNRTHCSIAQAAGTTRRYNVFIGPAAVAAISAGPGGTVEYHFSIPDLIIGDGFRFMVSCAAMQATDQLQNIKVHHLKWRIT
jgi:hypothetical protein